MQRPNMVTRFCGERSLNQGQETVYRHALNGLRTMPPRGGLTSSSDEEVKAGVDDMVRGSGSRGKAKQSKGFQYP
jgi:cytochrome c5